MKTFVVEQKQLVTILSSMQPICGKRTTIDATSSILFHVGHKELVLKSTDLEVSLQHSCPILKSSIEEVRSFLVSGKRIFELVKELDGDIAFALHDAQLIVQSAKVQLALNIKDAQEFPPFPERIENLMHLESSFLKEMLNKVSFLIPQNNSNPALNGLYFELDKHGMKMTATDGHCLAQATTKKYTLAEEKKWLLPRRAIFEIKKILDTSTDEAIFLGLCSNQLVFSGESFNFFTKLLVDPFPQYTPILEKTDFHAATVDRSQLIKTLRRSSCLLSGQFIATQFDFTKESIKASLHNKEVGKLEENLPLEKFSGDELTMRFYAPYLLNGLQAFVDDKVSFYLKNNTRPIIFESEGIDCHMIYLVMPVAPTANA
ncbi:MAG: DNA polymerase III subunit beta [Candidatus Babeliales bacterium]